MAYNKANGGVPIKGDASTSGVHNPKTGRVDNPQSLGGSIMNLGKSSCHEASSCEGGMTNISSGAGNEGAGSHKPVLKEDTSLVNYREPLDLPYKGRQLIAARHFSCLLAQALQMPEPHSRKTPTIPQMRV